VDIAGQLTDEQCVVQRQHFFVRVVIPVVDSDRELDRVYGFRWANLTSSG
jgi:hypothetical protein